MNGYLHDPANAPWYSLHNGFCEAQDISSQWKTDKRSTMMKWKQQVAQSLYTVDFPVIKPEHCNFLLNIQDTMTHTAG
jgi:hypothetical protein